jgi:hydrogenase maturation protein HypF
MHEESAAMRERRIVRFFGWVQGVGFRFTVERIAAHFPQLAGEVFNEDDHVTVDVEGTPADLGEFIDEILERPPQSSRIESTETIGAPVAGRRGFQIGRSR